jgi:restriction system protein
MPIPGYQTIMLPLLNLLSDLEEHSFRDMVEVLAKQFNLTDDERKELLPSGQQVFNNRVGWARTYIKKAGLIEAPKRGINIITQRGLDVLKNHPRIIDVKLLEQFPEFMEFKTAKKDANEEEKPEESNTQTPEEILDYSYQKIRKELAQDLLSKVIKLPPSFFEKLVVELLVKIGYGGSIKEAGKAIGKTNDEGIDGTIKEDKLGLDIIYVQAKRWQPGNAVGRPEIHKFVGALAGQGAKKGIFLTTSSFTKDAIEYTPKNETKIVLIDGEQLAQLMIDHDLGVSPVTKYEIKRIDNDYFGEE